MELPSLQQTLLDAFRQPPRDGFRSHLATLSEDEWAGLIDEARRLRVAPLLRARLKEVNDKLPAPALGRLEQVYVWNTKRNFILFQQLARFLRNLEGEGIDCIILKGAALAQALYGNIGLRVMRDIDLMVRADALPAAVRRLEELGFRAMEPYELQTRLLDYKDLPTFQHDETGAAFELHHHISMPDDPFAIAADELWEHAVQFPLAGSNALRLSAEHQLLHLSLHTAYQDGFQLSLTGLLDVDALLRRSQQPLDWDEVIQSARRWGIARGLYLVLHL